MKFSKSVQAYLKGNEFSNSLGIKISTENSSYLTRQEIILNQASGKKVVHLGCCDHIPLIKDKIERGLWLHENLNHAAKKCIGVDIDKKAIDYVKDSFGVENIIHGDITADEKIPELGSEQFDLMVMGEILEHIDNPVSFLRKIRLTYKENLKQILITVPNAFFIRNHINVKAHKEVINTDHKYWFSPYTLAKIASNAGYEVSDFYFCDERIKTKIGLKAKLQVIPYLKRKLMQHRLKKYPAYRSCLVMLIDL